MYGSCIGVVVVVNGSFGLLLLSTSFDLLYSYGSYDLLLLSTYFGGILFLVINNIIDMGCRSTSWVLGSAYRYPDSPIGPFI